MDSDLDSDFSNFSDSDDADGAEASTRSLGTEAQIGTGRGALSAIVISQSPSGDSSTGGSMSAIVISQSPSGDRPTSGSTPGRWGQKQSGMISGSHPVDGGGTAATGAGPKPRRIVPTVNSLAVATKPRAPRPRNRLEEIIAEKQLARRRSRFSEEGIPPAIVAEQKANHTAQVKELSRLRFELSKSVERQAVLEQEKVALLRQHSQEIATVKAEFLRQHEEEMAAVRMQYEWEAREQMHAEQQVCKLLRDELASIKAENQRLTRANLAPNPD